MEDATSPETQLFTQQLILQMGKKQRDKSISPKKKREAESLVLLNAQDIKFGEKCARCELNCCVKHLESVLFWARTEGLQPVYVIDQRDEIISQIIELRKISREEAGRITDNAITELINTGLSAPEALTMLSGYEECPKQGHVEKAKLKHKRRKK